MSLKYWKSGSIVTEDNGIFSGDSDNQPGNSSYTMATGDTSVESRSIYNTFNSTDEKVLFVDCADDDSSTPTIKVEISLYIGSGWSDYVEIESASAVPKEVKVSSYGKSWWIKNGGVKFKFTKSGAGAVTFTNARWL